MCVIWSYLSLLNWIYRLFFFKFQKFSSIISATVLSGYLSSILGGPIISMLLCLTVSHRSQRLFVFLFSFCTSGWIISIDYFSGSFFLLPAYICSWDSLVNFSFIIYFSTLEFLFFKVISISLLIFLIWWYIIDDEVKHLLRVKWESEKASLKLSIQKTEIIPSSPITLWQIEGKKVKAVTDFVFLGSKITVDGDCSYETKICLLLGRKAMTKLDSTLKSRDIAFLTKVNIVKAIFFPVVMYRCGIGP